MRHHRNTQVQKILKAFTLVVAVDAPYVIVDLSAKSIVNI